MTAPIPPMPDWLADAWSEYREAMKTWKGGPPPRQHWDEAPKAKKSRGPRKPDIKKLIEAAERDGKIVTSVTTPDGVTLHFDKTEHNTEASNNPWLDDLNKVTKQ